MCFNNFVSSKLGSLQMVLESHSKPMCAPKGGGHEAVCQQGCWAPKGERGKKREFVGFLFSVPTNGCVMFCFIPMAKDKELK